MTVPDITLQNPTSILGVSSAEEKGNQVRPLLMASLNHLPTLLCRPGTIPVRDAFVSHLTQGNTGYAGFSF